MQPLSIKIISIKACMLYFDFICILRVYYYRD